jgi:hypothetical protein
MPGRGAGQQHGGGVRSALGGTLFGWRRMLVALLVAGMVVLLVVGAYLAARGMRASPGAPPTDGTDGSLSEDGRIEVRLAIESADEASPNMARLVRDVAARMFASMPGAAEVVVRNRAGDFLGRAQRVRSAPAAIVTEPVLFPAHPFGFAHPHPPLAPDDDVVGQMVEHGLAGLALPTQRAVPDPSARHRPLSELLELPSHISRRLEDSDDPVEIVRALLEETDPSVSVDDEVVQSGTRAVVVVRAHIGDPVTPAMLNRAYVRFRQSGASVGVVLSPGIMPLAEIRRREMFDPALLHAGLDGMQRMVDAAALGADPLAFAAGPAVVMPAATPFAVR